MRLAFVLSGLLLSSTALAGDLVVQKAGGGSPATVIRQSDSSSDDWDALVEQTMLAAFDSNGSGDIDSNKELKLISCDVWTAIDEGVQAAWTGSGARAIYGFAKGYGWVGSVFGFNEKLRKSADKAMAKCGLQD